MIALSEIDADVWIDYPHELSDLVSADDPDDGLQPIQSLPSTSRMLEKPPPSTSGCWGTCTFRARWNAGSAVATSARWPRSTRTTCLRATRWIGCTR